MTQNLERLFISTKDFSIPEGYKRSKIGLIPNDWQISNVGEACKVVNNKRKPISEDERKKIKGCYPYYGPTKIQGYINEYAFEGLYALMGEDGDHFLRYYEKPVTLLVNGKFNVNNHAHVIKGKENCLTEWFYHFYRHRSIYKYLTRQGAKRYKLTKESLMQLPLPLPPLVEQRKIVDILSCWDKAIELKRKLIEQKKEQKNGLMQKLFTGMVRIIDRDADTNDRMEKIKSGEVPSGYEKSILGIIPIDWKVTQLEEVVEQFIVPMRDKPKKFEGDIPWCRIEDIDGKYLSDSKTNQYVNKEIVKEMNLKIHPKGTVICSCSANLGVCAIVTRDLITNQTFIGLKPTKDIDVEYLYYIMGFSSERLQRLSSGTTIAYLSRESFEKFRIPLPPIKEQMEISKILSTCDKEITLLEREVRYLINQRKGLMQLLLTGKIRVKV